MYQASINIMVCVRLSKIVLYLLSPRFCVLWFLFTNKGATDPSILSGTFPSLLVYHLLSAVLNCLMNILLSPYWIFKNKVKNIYNEVPYNVIFSISLNFSTLSSHILLSPCFSKTLTYIYSIKTQTTITPIYN